MLERIFGLFFMACGIPFTISAIVEGEPFPTALGLGISSIGVAHLIAALKQRVVIDGAGWHQPRSLTGWDEIVEIRLFRGTGRGPDEICTESDVRVPTAAFVPSPWFDRRVPRPTVDLLCHLQDDVAHELEIAPTPVLVELDRDQPMVGFVHPCSRCEAVGDAG